MRNFKLTIEYDGTDFSGWQIQPGRRTVQGELRAACSALAPGGVKIVGAGRTDAGVHAAGQVANAVLDTRLDRRTIMRALGARLPRDILVREVEEVPLAFHARRDARDRRYHYVFIRRPTALWRRYFHLVPGNLDTDAMRRELAALRGRRDFTPFGAALERGRTGRCAVSAAELIEAPPLVILSLTADRFLRSMVRIVAGTVLRAGTGAAVSCAAILAGGDRSAAGPALPAHALYLMEVRY